MDDIPVRRDGLQLQENRRFQERYWTAERVAWVTFGVFLIAALTGLTGGGGPLAGGVSRMGDVHVQYPSISRWTATETFRFDFPSEEVAHLVLETSFLDAFKIEGIRPEPKKSVAIPDGLRLEFAMAGKGNASVDIHVQVRRAGLLRYRMSETGNPRSFTTIALP